MAAIYGPYTGIDAQDGTSDQTVVIDTGKYHRLSVHLVTDGTLTGANGWIVEVSNAPRTDNTNSPDTTVYDWVDLGLAFTVPAGAATNQMKLLENVACKWVRVKWDSTGASGSGNVSARVFGKGDG